MTSPLLKVVCSGTYYTTQFLKFTEQIVKKYYFPLFVCLFLHFNFKGLLRGLSNSSPQKCNTKNQ